MTPVARAPLSSQLSPPLALDEDGFLVDPSTWTQETARLLSDLSGIRELTAQHWALITYIRDYHARFGAVPLMRRVCRSQNLDPDSVKQL
ncbi:MAG: TusE/DsrC/DsvC family sulfur relay protein, partial [Gammaproteobacteria bacterium]|nr:TusE/DsrC/DsvC family sulfur relay protein [Gammaproteobacteria bacterium]